MLDKWFKRELKVVGYVLVFICLSILFVEYNVFIAYNHSFLS